MSLAPYLRRNFATTADTRVASVIGLVLNSASVSASIRIDGFLSTFLYHCVSDPYTGNRYSCSSSNTNQTGTEMVRPDFLPVTLMLISRDRERRSLKASFRVGLLLMQLSFISRHGIARRSRVPCS